MKDGIHSKDVRDEVCSTFTCEIYAWQQQHGPFPLAQMFIYMIIVM